MDGILARAILGHTMAQSIWELLALVGPFALVFGAGAVLVIGPIIKSGGERYQHHPIRGDETPTQTNGSTKPSRAAATSGPTGEQAAAPSGTAPGDDDQ